MKFSVSVHNALTKADDASFGIKHMPKQTPLKKRPTMTSQKGMTLLEMLITLAVVAIVMTVVSPNVQKILSKNRTTAEINELSGVIQFARFTAIDQASVAVICPSADYASCNADWNQAKIVFIDTNGNNNREASEPLLMSTTAIASSNTMTGPSNAISFVDSGAANTSTSIQICPNSKDASLAHAININAQGRVRMSTDSNNNGIKEDTNGNELNCS